MRRMLCTFLAVCLLISLCACAAPEAEAPAIKPGRWVEEKIDLPMPENAANFRLFSHNGVLDAVFYNYRTGFNALNGMDGDAPTPAYVVGWSRSEDMGETWQPQDISFLQESLKNYQNPYCDFRIGDNGTVWFSLQEYVPIQARQSRFLGLFSTPDTLTPKEKQELVSLRYYTVRDRQPIEVSLPFSPFPTGNYVEFRFLSAVPDFFPLGDGSCLFSQGGTFSHIGADGSLLDSFEVIDDNRNDAGDILQVCGGFALAEFANTSVCRIDLSDGSFEQLPFVNGLTGSLAYGIDENGTAYTLSYNNISQVAAGSTLVEELIPGENYFFNSPNNTFRQIVSCGGALFTVANQQKLLRYRYDPDALPPTKKTVTVFSMHDDPVVHQTIAQLSLTDPGLSVNYRIGDDEISENMTLQDYIKLLNTELLAGTGPDVMILDGLGDPASYLASGVFYDLNELIDTNGLFPNLLAAGEHAGGLYAIPAGVHFSALTSMFGDIERRKTSLTLEEAAADMGEPFPVYPTLTSVLAESEEQAARKIFQKTAQGKSQIYLLSPSLDEAFEGLYLAALPELAGKNTDPAALSSFLNAVSWMRPKQSGTSYSLLETSVACTYNETMFNRAGLTVLPSLNGKKAFVPHTLAAVPQKKTPPDNAVAFLNAMLSEDVQAQNFYGHSLYAVETAELFQNLSNGKCVPIRESCLAESRFDLYGCGQDALMHMHDAVAQLDTPVHLDTARAQRFYDITCDYINEKISLDEAVEQILKSYSTEDTLSALELKK